MSHKLQAFAVCCILAAGCGANVARDDVGMTASDPLMMADETPVADEAAVTDGVTEEAPTGDEAPVATEAPVADEPEYDPFAGDMPGMMVLAHVQVLDGALLSVQVLHELYDYAVAHPDDPRPQLLMAWDAIHRDWNAFAIRHYRQAFEADARVAELPRMREDLERIAALYTRGVEHDEVEALLEDAYGPR